MESKVDSVTWALQNVGFKLSGYERQGSQRGAWYVSLSGDKLGLHTEHTEGGVPPCALPAGGHLANLPCARELAHQLVQKQALREGR